MSVVRADHRSQLTDNAQPVARTTHLAHLVGDDEADRLAGGQDGVLLVGGQDGVGDLVQVRQRVVAVRRELALPGQLVDPPDRLVVLP